MIKALIIGADGMNPNYLVKHPERYPNFTRIQKIGVGNRYSAYAQKRYRDGYVSAMNWSTIYTGLAPWEHKIQALDSQGHRPGPSIQQLQQLSPFWKVLNQAGYRVGIWNAELFYGAAEMDGYCVALGYEPSSTPEAARLQPVSLRLLPKDRWLLEILKGELPVHPYPHTAAELGCTFDQMRADPQLAWQFLENYHFQDSLEYFRNELEYYGDAMLAAQKKNPVDVMYFYTGISDTIGHFTMYCEDSPVLAEAYRLLDSFLGRLWKELEPENIVVLSDHGMENYRVLVDSEDPEIRREAFEDRDDAIWLPNGYIALEGRNGAPIVGTHSVEGTFLACGPRIRHGQLQHMYTVDIYPIILEMMGLEIPAGRSGYVQDIFREPVRNRDWLFPAERWEQRSRAAVLQCSTVSLTDTVLNELYQKDRFLEITVVGEEKYREIFLHNPRVSGFVPFEKFDSSCFDRIYTGVHTASGWQGHICTQNGKSEFQGISL